MGSLMPSGLEAMKRHRTFAVVKRDTALRILDGDIYRHVMDEGIGWEALELAWTTMVGAHESDMQCGILMHGLHTKDRAQIAEALRMMAGIKPGENSGK